MSTNTLRPGLTAAMTAGRALLAAGWRYDSTSPMADDTTIRTLLHPTGREIHARTVDGGEQTDLTMTGLTLEQVAGAVAGAGLVEPAVAAPPADDRAKLVAGLRALADFYEQHPTMPVPLIPSLLVSCSNLADGDDAAADLVRHAGELLGIEATPSSAGGWDVDGRFGSLTLRVYSTTRERMARYVAASSYDGVVEPAGSAS